jgi:hypothetical protein
MVDSTIERAWKDPMPHGAYCPIRFKSNAVHYEKTDLMEKGGNLSQEVTS